MTRNQEFFSCIIIKRQNVLLHFYISIHIRHECTVSSKSSTPVMVLWWRRVHRSSLQPLPITPLCAELKMDTGDHGNNKRCSQSRDTHLFAETTSLTIFSNSTNHPCRGHVKQYTSQPSVHVFIGYYRQRSHFLYIKKQQQKNILFWQFVNFQTVQKKKRQNSHQWERTSRIQVTVQKRGPGGSTWSMHVFMLPCSPLKPSCEDILYKKATWLFLHY